MKHIQIYESFNSINEGEGAPLKDIIKLADKQLIEGMFPDRKFKKEVIENVPTYFAIQEDSKKMHNTVLYASANFDPSFNNGSAIGQVTLNTFMFEKIVTPQQQAKVKSLYDVGSPISDLISEVKDVWSGVMNKTSKSELMKWLKEHGWKEKKSL